MNYMSDKTLHMLQGIHSEMYVEAMSYEMLGEVYWPARVYTQTRAAQQSRQARRLYEKVYGCGT